jgi:hypothetical protein
MSGVGVKAEVRRDGVPLGSVTGVLGKELLSDLISKCVQMLYVDRAGFNYEMGDPRVVAILERAWAELRALKETSEDTGD